MQTKLSTTTISVPVRRRRRGCREGGFTLIEAALTTVIVGTGVLAIVASQQAYHIKNDWAQRSGTALLLANEIRELTLPLPVHDPITGDANLGAEGNEPDLVDYDDLDDFAGVVVAGMGEGLTIDPPINALRQEVAGMSGWSQFVEIEGVMAGNIGSTLTSPIGSTEMVRVSVTVRYRGPQDTEAKTITQLAWIVPTQ